MATLSWTPAPNTKVDRLRVQSGPQLCHFSSFADLDTRRGLRPDAQHRRGRGNVAERHRYPATTGPLNLATNRSVRAVDDELGSMRWDDVVDIACVGNGVASLASAVVAADAGLDVFLADASSTPDVAVDLPDRLGVDEAESETHTYLVAVSDGIGDLNQLPRRAALPVAAVSNGPVDDGGRIAPFFGRSLASWATSCLASPYGALYTDVIGRNMTTLRTENMGHIEAVGIGSITADDGADLTVGEYLAAQANSRGIAVHRSSPLHRLVFDDLGSVIGVVVSTPDGVRAIRTRRGAVLASGGADVDARPLGEAVAGSATLCVMSRTASRFAQIGLLVEEGADGTAYRA